MRIFVTGATGTVGRHVVQRLLTACVDVRALTRRPESVGLPAAVEVVGGNLENPESLAPAFDGVDRMYLLATGPPNRSSNSRSGPVSGGSWCCHRPAPGSRTTRATSSIAPRNVQWRTLVRSGPRCGPACARGTSWTGPTRSVPRAWRRRHTMPRGSRRCTSSTLPRWPPPHCCPTVTTERFTPCPGPRRSPRPNRWRLSEKPSAAISGSRN